MIIKSGKGRTDWDRLLPALCYAYRQATHCSTGHPPFELVFGREVQGPLTLTKAQREGEEDTGLKDVPEHFTSLRSTLKQMSDIVAKNDNAAKEQHKHITTTTLRTEMFSKAILCYAVFSEKRQTSTTVSRSTHCEKESSPVSYQLDNTGGKDRMVHTNDLKPWKVPTASALTIAAVELEDDPEIVLPDEIGALPTVSKSRTSVEKKEAEQIISYNVELFKGKAGRTQSATHSIHTQEVEETTHLSDPSTFSRPSKEAYPRTSRPRTHPIINQLLNISNHLCKEARQINSSMRRLSAT